MKYVMLLMAVLFTGCCENEPRIVEEIFASDKSGSKIETSTFKLPHGFFRGVIWPSSGRNVFQIWIVDDGDTFFNIPNPIGYPERETTSEWVIKEQKLDAETTKWTANERNGKRQISIDLPSTSPKFHFRVFRSRSGDEILIFMNHSEATAQRGLFGIVTLPSLEI